MKKDTFDVILFSDVSNSIGFGRYAGPYRIATELRNHGFSVLVVDFFSDFSSLQIRDILQLYMANHTLFIGFSTTLMSLNNPTSDNFAYKNDYASISEWQKGIFAQNAATMQEIFSYIKQKNALTQIVVGGSKASAGGVRGVDWWVWGEADASIVALAKHFSENSAVKYSSFSNGSKRIISEDYPYVDFCHSQIGYQDHDFIFLKEVLPIEISRGCIFNCSFCTFKHRGKKASESLKNPESLFQEMSHNHRHFKTTEYLFSDDTFNDSIEKIREIIALKNRLGFDLQFSTFCRLDMITRHPEMADLLLEAGLKCVNFGIESFNETALKQAHKYAFPAEKIKETLFFIKEKWKDNIVVTANFIVGLPGESEESVRSTADWLSANNSPIDSFNFLPLFVVPKYGDVEDKTAILTNKMGVNPEKYKILLDYKTGDWEHDLMNKRRAIELVNEFESSSVIRRKTTVNRSGFYGRLKNIGFSHEDCVSDLIKDLPAEEFRRRRKILFKRYFTALMSGKTEMSEISDLFLNELLEPNRPAG